jgi:hypothetical protein
LCCVPANAKVAVKQIIKNTTIRFNMVFIHSYGRSGLVSAFFGKGENLTAWSAPFVFCFLFKPFQKSTNLYIYGRPIGRP